MTIALFGATGQLGRRILNELIARGHVPRVLVRNRLRLTDPVATDNIFEGDIRSIEDVSPVIAGADAVISAIGMPDITIPDTVVSDGLRVILQSMKNLNVSRLIAVGGASVLPHKDGGLNKDHDWPELLTHVSADHERQWNQLKVSDVDWTLVCPVFFNDEVPRATYRVAKDAQPEGSEMVTIDNLATFIVNEIEAKEFLRTRVGIVSDRPAEDAELLYD